MTNNTQTMRGKEELQNKYTLLKSEAGYANKSSHRTSSNHSSESNDDLTSGIDAEALQRDGKINGLDWLLEEQRSVVDVIVRYRELNNTAFTGDRVGRESKCRVAGEKNILKWAIQNENEPVVDPRGIEERFERIHSELMNLNEDLRTETEADDELREVHERLTDALKHSMSAKQVYMK